MDELYVLMIVNGKNQRINIIHLESFSKVVKLKFNLSSISNIDNYLRPYSNLKYLQIRNSVIKDSNIFSNLKHLEKLQISRSNIESFDSIWSKNMTKLN